MNGKTTALVSYIGWIGWLIALLAGDKEDQFAKFHLNQNLIIYLIGLIPVIGSIAALVLWIMGLINAVNGEAKPLPVIGEWHILK